MIEKMKFIAIVSAALIASASAFAPAASSERAATALNMDRRAAMGGIAAAAGIAAMPGMALADGATNTASIQRAKYVYGVRISGLKDAVAKGDFAAVAAEKNAFILYNSGAYPGSKNKVKKGEAIAATNAIFSAIRNQ